MASLFLRVMQCLSYLFIFIHISDSVQHGTNLVWTQRSLRKFGLAKIVGIVGDPKEWVQEKVPNVRQISAPSLLWHFKAIAFNYVEQTLYWSESGNKRIQSLRLNGTTVTEHVYTGTSSDVHGLVYDWLSGNLYWSDATYNWIVLMPLYCPEPKPLQKIIVDTGLDRPGALALFPKKGYLFWSDRGAVPKIELSDLIGNNRRVLVTDKLMYPRGLAVDFDRNLLYWVDSGLDTIECVEFTGANRKSIVPPQAGTKFYGIALYDKFVFITEQNQRFLRIYDKFTGKSYVNYRLGSTPYGVVMYEESTQSGTMVRCQSLGCQHICIQDPLLGPRCHCGQNFELMDDNVSCKDNGRFHDLIHIFSIMDAICYYPINLADMTLINITLQKQCFLDNGHGYMALGYNFWEKMLYFSENGTNESGKIYRVHLKSGSVKEQIVEGIGEVQGLVVEWLSSNLYWTDSTYQHISVSRLDGSFRRVIISDNLTKPIGIAVHPFKRQLFWTDTGGEPKIETSFLDGSHRRALITGKQLGSPNHLFLDFRNNKLYWSDSDRGLVRYYDLDTQMTSSVLTVQNSHIFGISIFQDYILWTDRGDKNGVHVAHLETGEKIRGIIHPTMGMATDLITYSKNNQPLTDKDKPCNATIGCSPCSVSNGECAQLCLPNKGSVPTCACTFGYKLADDGKNCSTEQAVDNFLIVADSSQRQLYQVNLMTGLASAIQTSTNNRPIAVDFDANDMLLYWSDVEAGVIKKATLNGSFEVVVEVLPKNSLPDGIAIDYINRLLFFSDMRQNIIGVASMDNPSRNRTLVTTQLDHPRDVVAHPLLRIIFWTDWGNDPKIEKAAMDGSGRMTLVHFRQPSWPNGLTIDYKAEKLYWCNARSNKIMASDFQGDNQEVVLKEDAAHYFGIFVMGDFLYVTDWQKKYIMKMNKNKPEGIERIGGEIFGRLNGIHGFNSSEKLQGSNICSGRPCEYLCLPNPSRQWVCACADGVQLNPDETTCAEAEQSTVNNSVNNSLATWPQFSFNTSVNTFPSINSTITATPDLVPTTNVDIGSPETRIANDGPSKGIISTIVIVIFVVCIAGLVAGVVIYRRWRSDGMKRLKEDTSPVDAYYRLAFPDQERTTGEGGTYDAGAGIENPFFGSVFMPGIEQTAP